MARLDEVQHSGPASRLELSSRDQQNVDEWISKAKVSLQVFGDSIPQSYIMDQDPEDSPTSGEDTPENQQELEYAAGFDPSTGISNGRRHTRLRTHSSTSNTLSPYEHAARQSEKPLTVPSEAVPFGLMAGLSLRKYKTGQDIQDSPPASSGIGVANENFFRAGLFYHCSIRRTLITQIVIPVV